MGTFDDSSPFAVNPPTSFTISNDAPVKTILKPKIEREDRVLLPFWTSGPSRKQLKLIAVDEEKTQQALLAEALNMLFKSRGKPLIG